MGDEKPRTVLDPVKPTVVRRRVVETLEPQQQQNITRGYSTEGPQSRRERELRAEHQQQAEDEQGPPSSVNVARALASLRADELTRLEDLLRADEEGDEEEMDEEALSETGSFAAIPVAPVRREEHEPTVEIPTVPTLLLPREISVAELAKRLSLDSADFAATLVAQGFYASTPKTMLSRETARTIAKGYGLLVEDAPDPPPGEEPKSKPKRAAAKKKTTTTR